MQYIGPTALVVRDYDEALQFFVGTLGFELIEDTYIAEQNKRWVVVAPPGSKECRLLLARAVDDEQVSRVGNQTGGRVFLFYAPTTSGATTSTEALAGLAQAHAVAGNKLVTDRIVREIGEGGHRYVSPYNIARVYGSIGDKQSALEWLERAYQEHNPDLIEMTREPSFSNIRSDGKFRDLVGRIGWPRTIGD